MAQLSVILDAEKARSTFATEREIRLYPDGSFYRAYEWSAWLCCRYIRQSKITKRMLKSVEADMVFIGFPQTSIEKYQIEGSTLSTNEDKSLTLVLPEGIFPSESERATMQIEFQAWRDSVPMTESKQSTKQHTASALDDSAQPMSMTGIMQQIMSFSIERKSPIECMLFLAELKEKIAKLL